MDEKKERKQAVVNAGDAELKPRDSLWSMIFAGDIETAIKTTITSVIVPKISETLTESVNTAMNSFVYGDDYVPSVSSKGTNYNVISTSKSQSKARTRSEKMVADHRNVRDILFKDKAKAINVKLELEENARHYPVTTVNDFFDFANMADQAFSNDDKYGWDNLEGKEIRVLSTRVFNEDRHMYEDRYFIDLPKAIPIDD